MVQSDALHNAIVLGVSFDDMTYRLHEKIVVRIYSQPLAVPVLRRTLDLDCVLRRGGGAVWTSPQVKELANTATTQASKALEATKWAVTNPKQAASAAVDSTKECAQSCAPPKRSSPTLHRGMVEKS
eukprot:1817021-Amphidinium_carterae.1